MTFAEAIRSVLLAFVACNVINLFANIIIPNYRQAATNVRYIEEADAYEFIDEELSFRQAYINGRWFRMWAKGSFLIVLIGIAMICSKCL